MTARDPAQPPDPRFPGARITTPPALAKTMRNRAGQGAPGDAVQVHDAPGAA